MKTYDVAIPITGLYHVTVEANNELEAETLAAAEFSETCNTPLGMYMDDPICPTYWFEQTEGAPVYIDEVD